MSLDHSGEEVAEIAVHVCRLNPVWTAAFERRLPE